MSNASIKLYIHSEMLQLGTHCSKLQMVITNVANVEPKEIMPDHELKKMLAKIYVTSMKSFQS